MADFTQGAPDAVSPLSQSALQTQPTKLNDDFEPTQQGLSAFSDDTDANLRRANSTNSQSHTLIPSRGGTLKKKRSLSRKGSLKRSGSRKNSLPGGAENLGLDGQQELNGEHAREMNSVFITPVPTSGNPTEILANRFQGKSSIDLFDSILQEVKRQLITSNSSVAKGAQRLDHVLS